MADRGGRGGRGGGGGDRGRGGRGGPRGGGGDRGRGGGDRGRGGGDSGRGGGGGYAPRGGGDRGGGDRGRGRGGFETRGDRGGRGSRGGGGGGRGGPLAVFTGAGTIPAPDATVTALEDAINRNLSARGGREQSLDVTEAFRGLSVEKTDAATVRFPERPGFATRGTATALWANYFRVQPNPVVKLYQYRIAFGRTPKDDADVYTKKRERLVTQLLTEGPLMDLNERVATDFRRNLICMERLEDDKLTAKITYRFEDEDQPSARAPTYQVTLTLENELTMGDLIDYLTSSNASAALANKASFTQAMNIILGHVPKANKEIYSVSNKHYPFRGNIAEGFDLYGGLIAWRGYFMSVRNATARVLVNVQVKHAALYTAQPLEKSVAEWRQDGGGDFSSLSRWLKNLRVEVTHLPTIRTRSGNTIKRLKTIAGLAHQSDGRRSPHPPRGARLGANASQVSFYMDPEGRAGVQGVGADGYVTVAKFFQSKYKRQAGNAPIINIGNASNPVYVPMNVCVVPEGQPVRGLLSPNQTAQMINFAVRRPEMNAQSIVTNGVAALRLGGNPILNNFGMNVSTNLITVPGRILNGPAVRYRGTSSIAPRFGSWNMANIKFHAPGATQLSSWCILWIRSGGRSDAFSDWPELGQTVDYFYRELQNCGVNALAPKRLRFECGTSQDRGEQEQNIKDQLRQISQHPEKIQLVFVVLPTASTDIYNVVKTAGELDLGLQSVFVVGSKFRGRGDDGNNAQYWANVALKFNLKFGGRNQALDDNKLHVISEGKTMIIGLDVTHPSPGSAETAPSVAAMVASIDKHLGQWPAVLRRQTLARQEMVVGNTGDMLKSRLDLWQKKNGGRYPENILVYRDGVSEGQYEQVVTLELTEFRKACADVYPADQTRAGLPRFSFIIVGKRHHTRFYPTTTNRGQIDERSGNTPNGTVVDRGVTESHNWDFFLQAHTALQGTARPAHYFVVYDRIFAEYYKSRAFPQGMQNVADVLEDLTHNMSYMFGRATKAVSICPPAYYADLACERARVYLREEFVAGSEVASVANGGQASAGGVVGGAGGTGSARASGASRSLELHPNVRDSMFYI